MGALLVAALAVYDVVVAVRVHCRPAGATDVYALGELDRLPGDAHLSVRRAGSATALPARLSLTVGTPLHLVGTADPRDASGPVRAVFAVVDAELLAAHYDARTRAFDVSVPSELLTRGPHRIAFEDVPDDLAGYRVGTATTEVVVRSRRSVRAPEISRAGRSEDPQP